MVKKLTVKKIELLARNSKVEIEDPEFTLMLLQEEITACEEEQASTVVFDLFF